MDDLSKLWDFYNNRLELTDEEAEELGYDGFWKKKYYVERYGDFDTFVKDDTARCPMAIVDKDKWIELGAVGWFGCDDATPQSIRDYYEFVEKFFADPQNQDRYMTFVDCHI